jgi:homogentisate 1,2-dioxygenase
VVALAPPAVGPAPASLEANSFVTLSISVVHGPAPAVPTGKATRAQAPSSNVIVFMAFSPGCDCEKPRVRIPTFHINREREPTFRGGKQMRASLVAARMAVGGTILLVRC